MQTGSQTEGSAVLILDGGGQVGGVHDAGDRAEVLGDVVGIPGLDATAHSGRPVPSLLVDAHRLEGPHLARVKLCQTVEELALGRLSERAHLGAQVRRRADAD